MRHWPTLRDVAFAGTRAVIINCGTKWVTTLALMSVLHRTSYPPLLINCESTDGSREHFTRLAELKGIEFDWLEWPLRPHPVALDELFDNVRADRVLLVDSDLEIVSAAVPTAMERALDSMPHAYGAGFRHGPAWIGTDRGMHANAGYYVERMWIPLVLLRTDAVRTARKQGVSFLNERPFTDIPHFPWLARLLGLRYRIRGLRRLRFPVPGRVERSDLLLARIPSAPRPSFVEFDTGAKLHLAMLGCGWTFSELPLNLWGEVNHYHGVTRAERASFVRHALKKLRLATTETETTQEHVMADVRRRLADVYGIGEISKTGST